MYQLILIYALISTSWLKHSLYSDIIIFVYNGSYRKDNFFLLYHNFNQSKWFNNISSRAHINFAHFLRPHSEKYFHNSLHLDDWYLLVSRHPSRLFNRMWLGHRCATALYFHFTWSSCFLMLTRGQREVWTTWSVSRV